MIFTCLRRQPKQQRSRDRVNLILDAAASLLAEHGPDGTTITGVSERTGLATSSIYDYVDSDRQLIGAVAERGLDAIHTELSETIGVPSSVEHFNVALSNGLQLFLRCYQSEAGLREALSFIDADPVLTQINMDDTRRNAALITAAIASAIGPLQPESELSDAVFLMTYLSGALAGLAARVDADEAAKLIAQFERMMVLLVSIESNPQAGDLHS